MTATTTDARTALAEAIAQVAEAETVIADLSDEDLDLDPIEDAVLIAKIRQAQAWTKEAGALKRKREKAAREIKAAIHEKGHKVLCIDGLPAAALTTGVQKTDWDYDLLERLAPVAVAKSRTITHTGEQLNFK